MTTPGNFWNFQPNGAPIRDSFIPDNLVGGDDFDVISKSVKIKSGSGILPRGTVLEATGAEFQKVTADANALYILAEDLDATAAAVTTTAYVTGSFNKNKLTIGAGCTLAGIAAVLEPRSIFLVDSVA